MSQDKLDHGDDLKAVCRRSRKDEQGRDYVCGCGKRYLSYPALYTHIKTKHHGQQPEGTQKTGVIPTARKPKPKLDQKFLKQIQNLVQLQNLNILSHLDENAQGSIPFSHRIRKENLTKQIMEAYGTIVKHNTTVNLDKKSSLQNVLVCYLIGVGQFASEAMFTQYYCPFARYFRHCYHQYAQQVYEVCFKNRDTRKQKTINTQECKLVPIICDFFLRYYIPYQKKDNDFQSVMEGICFDFCHWMYLQKLTIVQVSLKRKINIRKNLIDLKLRQKKGEDEKQAEQDKDEKYSHQHHSSEESEIEKMQEQKEFAQHKKSEDPAEEEKNVLINQAEAINERQISFAEDKNSINQDEDPEESQMKQQNLQNQEKIEIQIEKQQEKLEEKEQIIVDQNFHGTQNMNADLQEPREGQQLVGIPEQV